MDNAFEWAKSKNFIRKNPIHGEQEAKLVLSESFEIVDETGATTELSGSIEAEEPIWLSTSQQPSNLYSR